MSNAFRLSLRKSWLLCLATTLAPIGAQAEIIVVGLGPTCGRSTLDAAIAQAKSSPGPDEIRLTRTIEYKQIAATIQDQDLTIMGGFADCSSSTPQGFTMIDGAGGTTRSVFEIRGAGVVRLSGLQISGGDENDGSDGGGVDYKGYGELVLDNINISDNRAGYGGGLYFKGEGAGAVLTFGDLTIIQNNEALHNGGGIHVTGRAKMFMEGHHNIVLDNRAIGVPVDYGNEDGMGGGLYVKAPAKATIGSSGLLDSGVTFYANEARLGGGIATAGHVDGHDAQVILYSAHAQAAQRLLFNRAREKGGAIYLRTAGNSNGVHGISTVCMDDTSLEGNSAPRGGAVQLDSHDITAPGGQGTQGPEFFLNHRCGGLGARRKCEHGQQCTQFIGNRTEDENGERTNGGIIEAEEYSTVNLIGVMAKDNVGGSLLRIHDKQVYYINGLSNSIVWRNDFSRFVIETDGDQSAGVAQCTISGNTLHGEHVFKMGGGGFNSVGIAIYNTVIDQPGKFGVKLDGRGGSAGFKVAHLFTNASFANLPAADRAYLSDQAPGFVDADAGDFRLLPGAPAIDYGKHYNDGLSVDIVGNTRTVDRPEPDLSGWRDIGAYEMPVD